MTLTLTTRDEGPAQLRSPLPLACKTFIKDIGTSLHENENAILEFLTLFELTIAIFNLDKVAGLTDDYIEEISSCIDILLHSYSSWASQSQSSTNQHNFGIAVGAIQLNRELDNVYKSFLGEDILWKTFIEVLGHIHKMAPHFLPWHGILTKKHQQNESQMVHSLNHNKEDIGAVVGAGMASATVAINQCYQAGTQKVIAAVKGMAVHTENEQDYLSSTVNLQLKDLLHSLAKECVHQAEIILEGHDGEIGNVTLNIPAYNLWRLIITSEIFYLIQYVIGNSKITIFVTHFWPNRILGKLRSMTREGSQYKNMRNIGAW
ncbi:uncharacterized protein LACBIDRAFT_322507 [Laccaria bicolor S238N-H82]|uniref:Predicted protein n=1 Tax=Laccaria bicolor (strain S238N-H82 / ATCC MYA-4686) TaxID=486041 RepID=B0CWJ2_LACBS|nr:uncharacterized protein LACBIDRAFT_322507 [Laccaria bicolor S238N-H82]EDR13076.1 predicted protein [Laccaria bicolor S238N-H82]|eukprot:XP_001875574.1 predicted protein [Laccaria bicolor S238N-H82]